MQSPSRLARRVVDVCGLAQLIAPHPTDATAMLEAAGALGSWVPVPSTDRVLLPVPTVVGADVEVEVEPALALAGSASVIAAPSPDVASLPGPHHGRPPPGPVAPLRRRERQPADDAFVPRSFP